MLAGELKAAVDRNELAQFLRAFCGSGMVTNGAPSDWFNRAEAVSAHVLGKPDPFEGAIRGPSMWSDWRQYAVDTDSDVAPSPYRFRRGTRQVSGTLARRGPGCMHSGVGVVPPPGGPLGDWVLCLGGWDLAYVEYPRGVDGSIATGPWGPPSEGTYEYREHSAQAWQLDRTLASRVPGAYVRQWQWPGCNNTGRYLAFHAQPGFALCNMDIASIGWFVQNWGRGFCEWFVTRMREARFLATRHTREGAGEVFAQLHNPRVLACLSCGRTGCQCNSVEMVMRHRGQNNTRRVRELEVQLRRVNDEITLMQRHEGGDGLVTRVSQACEEAMNRRFIKAARFDTDHAHIFMGPFEFDLDAERWENNGRIYTWPAGRYRMPPVWLRVPWNDPGSVQVLDLDGSPHPHGHVGAGGGNGMPCLGGDRVQRDLAAYWRNNPMDFIMHWWNYMNQYNEYDRGIVGPIHTACELVQARDGGESRRNRRGLRQAV